MNGPDTTADREIVLTRVFNAPSAIVFQAFTDPKHVDHWWAPRGFKAETTDMDVLPGGAWNYAMRHPQYGEFKNGIGSLPNSPPPAELSAKIRASWAG